MRSWLQKLDEIVHVPRFSERTRAAGNPAENRLIVRNGRVTIGGIALSSARLKFHRHEDAVRVVDVIAERLTLGSARNASPARTSRAVPVRLGLLASRQNELC